MIMTKKSFWQKRNFLKFRLVGLVIFGNKVVTNGENYKLEQIGKLRRELLDEWEKNNKLIKDSELDQPQINY